MWRVVSHLAPTIPFTPPPLFPTLVSACLFGGVFLVLCWPLINGRIRDCNHSSIAFFPFIPLFKHYSRHYMVNFETNFLKIKLTPSPPFPHRNLAIIFQFEFNFPSELDRFAS